MTITTIPLPTRPLPPDDSYKDYALGSPEYDAARQAYCREMRHYKNSLTTYYKRCREFKKFAQERKD